MNTKERIKSSFEVGGCTVLELVNPVNFGILVKCPFPVTTGMQLTPEQFHYIQYKAIAVTRYLGKEGFSVKVTGKPELYFT